MATALSDLLNLPAEAAARRLLGCWLVRDFEGQRLVARIVETEAYDQADAASHSFRGSTPRNAVMFGPAGRLYVYFTYGRHYCCNVVCGPEGWGAAVLIRAIEPLEGQSIMRRNRAMSGVALTNGPAKLCQALGIDRRLNGHDLHQSPLKLRLQPALPVTAIVCTTRIGIRQAADLPRRFYIRDNNYVSHP